METRTKTAPPDGSLAPLADTDLSAPPSSDDSSPPSEPDLTGHRISHFVVQQKLGQGGMGVVYAAEDTLLHRKVALKILPSAVTQNPERRRRFVREARAASAIAHPTIATIFEVGEDGDHVFLAMELVEGKTLRQILEERGGPLEIPDALRITREIALGLAKAHEAGIIHRDLKPENVMLGGDGLSHPNTITKILDFGLAKHTGAPDALAPTVTDFATVEGRILGTPGYMSPEQSKGKPVDARTDLFALGVVLYELLTGERPFRGSTAVEVLIAVDRDPYPPPSAINPRVSPDLDRLVARCLEKRPDDRFATCRDLIDALSNVSLENAENPAAAFPAARPETSLPSTLNARRSRFRLAIPLGAAGLLVAGAGLWIARSNRNQIADTRAETAPPTSANPNPAPIPSSTQSPAPETSPIAAPPPPPRRPCLESEPGWQKCRDKDVIPWCDLRGASIACCGRGLVPTGTDGICGCAPGGTNVREVLIGGCQEPPSDREEAYQRVRFKASDGATACFRPFFEAGKANNGTFAAEFALTPEGEVIEARVNLSTMPQQEAQVCAINILRATRFPPPRAEDAGKILSFGFVMGEVGKMGKKRP
jgi:serine/threonine protein kinase